MKTLILMLAAGLTALPCVAQTQDNQMLPKFYKVDFVVKELEAGKIVSSRNYTMGVQLRGGNFSVRSGDKVSVATGPNQFTYLDVGVNIDCKADVATANEIFLLVMADISSVVTADKASGQSPPTVSQTRWNSAAVVAFKKPTTIFTSDGAASRRQTQLEVTATPLQ